MTVPLYESSYADGAAVDAALELGASALQYASAPATASATGTAGQVAYADGFWYVCIATNTWQRAAIATWS